MRHDASCPHGHSALRGHCGTPAHLSLVTSDRGRAVGAAICAPTRGALVRGKACHSVPVGTRPARLAFAGVALVVLFVVLASVYSYIPHHELPDDFDFYGEEITEARRTAVRELGAQLEAVEGRAQIEPLGLRGRIDSCAPGQDNFTRRDQYAYTCTLELVRLFPVREPARSEASRLGEALIEGDCPKGTTTDFALAEHRQLEDLPETGGDCTRGSQLVAPRIAGWFRVDSTPDELRSAATELPSPCSLRADEKLCEEAPLDLAAAARGAPRGAVYLAVVVARTTYHTVRW